MDCHFNCYGYAQKSFLSSPHLHLYFCHPSFHGSLDLHTLLFHQFAIDKLDSCLSLLSSVFFHPFFLVFQSILQSSASFPDNIFNLSLLTRAHASLSHRCLSLDLWPLSNHALFLLIPIFSPLSVFSHLWSLHPSHLQYRFLDLILLVFPLFSCSFAHFLHLLCLPLALSSDHPFFFPNISPHFKPPYISLPAIRPLWSFLPAFVLPSPSPSSSSLPPSLPCWFLTSILPVIIPPELRPSVPAGEPSAS